MLRIDNTQAMFQDLLTAAKQYVACSLVHPSVGGTANAQDELERAAVCYVRAAHKTFGAMWVELKQSLGVMGGSTDTEHQNMLQAIETLKIERDEAVRKLAVVQVDANVALEQRREADRKADMANRMVEVRDAALELACDRARQYQEAAASVARTMVETLDKLIKLEEENRVLRDALGKDSK